MIRLHLDFFVDAVFRGLLLVLIVASFAFTDPATAQEAGSVAASNTELTNWIIGAGLAFLSLLVSVVGFFLTRTLKAIEDGQDKILAKVEKMDDRVKHVEVEQGTSRADVANIKDRLARMEAA